MAARAALQYETEAFATNAARLMGRQSAGESFLKAWVRYAAADPLTCYSPAARTLEAFQTQVAGFGAVGQAVRAGPDAPGPLRAAGALWLAGPGVHEAAWMRRRVDPRAWSIVGVTHTTASARAMDALAGLCQGPVEDWDALICTSAAVRDTVERVMAAQQRHLRDTVGATRFAAPRLPIIPLGVHCDDFAPRPGARAQWRTSLGIPDASPVVLCLGRLSFHAKADPAAMYMALEQAAASAPSPPHLILAGWFANAGQETYFRKAAATLAPSVTLHVLDGRERDIRRDIWAAADAFCLLADNIQETFGLAPVEAMAAGLPVVASDWDGFRDTVISGVHGYLVPTLMAPPGSGEALAAAHEGETDTYDGYIGAASQHAAVDVAAAAAAFAALFQDPARARALGAAGQAHARASLDWRAIIPRYLDLLTDLGERRAAAGRAPLRGQGPNPARLDPFEVFAGYPTALLTDETRLRRTARPADGLEDLRRAAPRAATLAAAPQLWEWLDRAGEGATVAQIIGKLAGEARAQALRSLVWLCKLDLLRAEAP